MASIRSIRSGIGESMNDRYLFKAKDCNSIWRAGLLIALQEGRCAIEEKEGSKWACDSETLCQCTGLKDKNGKLIWENDIVKRNFYLYSSEAKYEERENCGIVKYDKEYARFGYQCSVFAMLSESKKHDTIEVIGNIFDNKELLESEEN
jgi:uncharacterized phage protein (TIGR01671 family)